MARDSTIPAQPPAACTTRPTIRIAIDNAAAQSRLPAR
jgi:hypothetical protein